MTTNNAKDTVLPFTFTDIAKAIREAMGLIDDVAVRVKQVAAVYERTKSKSVARSLDVFTFQNDGSRRHLERIAAGEAVADDFQAIVRRMDDTGAEVENAIDRLQNYRNFIAERYGLTLANELNELIYGKGGKASIRMDLLTLAGMNHEMYSASDIAREAQLILSAITELNKKIEDFHATFVNAAEGKKPQVSAPQPRKRAPQRRKVPKPSA